RPAQQRRVAALVQQGQEQAVQRDREQAGQADQQQEHRAVLSLGRSPKITKPEERAQPPLVPTVLRGNALSATLPRRPPRRRPAPAPQERRRSCVPTEDRGNEAV